MAVAERLDVVRQRERGRALERGASPRDVDLLLGEFLQRPLAWLFAHGDEMVDSDAFAQLLARREAGEPVQYIRGFAEFYGREFFVDRRVLIPRPETELLVEEALRRLAPGARVIDAGTGSGCIPITMKLERADLDVTSVDLSPAALAVASRNRRRLGADVVLAASDLLSSVRGTFDAIVSNPPYIASGAVPHLSGEVRDWEPEMALTPGPRGTEVIERLLDQAKGHLAPAGFVAMEFGYGQESAMRRLSQAAGYRVEDVVRDLAGIPRHIFLRRG